MRPLFPIESDVSMDCAVGVVVSAVIVENDAGIHLQQKHHNIQYLHIRSQVM